MFSRFAPDDRLDPRRSPRGLRRRDFASGMAMVSVPRVHELIASIMVRLGLVR